MYERIAKGVVLGIDMMGSLGASSGVHREGFRVHKYMKRSIPETHVCFGDVRDGFE
jgi:hypothetical protein